MLHSLRRRLLSTNFPDGYGKTVLSEVDSTNAHALRISKIARGPEWILGLKQTQGRGRRGRPWADPTGNFAATLLLFPNDALDQIALRSFVAACALYQTFTDVLGNKAELSLKWPNDVLLNDRKVAGILLETQILGPQSVALAIGMGVNLRHAPQPDQLEARAVAPVSIWEQTQVNITPEAFLDTLATQYHAFETQFTTLGFAPIRAFWLSHAARLGEVITARVADREITGTFDTVDETGHLILVTDQGRETIAAADIFF